jgi:glycosyltransferase involved in cell wall biosynthesis
MNDSKTILMLCGFRIFPAATGGHVHSTTIARALARMGYQVLVYCLAGRREDYRLRDMLRHPYRRVQIEPGLIEETNLGPGFGLLQAIARRLEVPRIWQYALLERGFVPRRLKAELLKAEIIIADFPFCPPVPGLWSDKPWFMISHELEFRLLEQGSPRERRFSAWMRRVEESAPRKYRDIFTCADEDRHFFRQHDVSGALKFPFIRCGVDPKAYEVARGTRERVRTDLKLTEDDWLFVFSGSGYGPNLEALEALKDFCRREAEFLARERVYFLALGSMARTPFREGAMIATGRVPEVVPYFAAGDAGLNPIMRGSGSNVKLFEYLAARLPVISTLFGVRGTTLEPDIDFLPYAPENLKTAVQQFLGKYTREQWKQQAELVWARHRRSCDIQQLVTDALSQRPEFTLPTKDSSVG